MMTKQSTAATRREPNLSPPFAALARQVRRYLETDYKLDPESGNFKPPVGANMGGMARSASGSYLTPARVVPKEKKAKKGKKGK
jgi:hypothetical protein